ncbi:hypothetical protein [Botrimarina mediterranea]|uniref:Uncharacterized protein n=1 Tax=Botrimarina mediterranea TaxID=2528022 RepID=A0A518K934_9BACT|nr:hypothetical protein [Botrimarina mediterranea]QDV74287.1 hypothetical protein Spa11_24880 [Botrimarina mediterranea]
MTDDNIANEVRRRLAEPGATHRSVAAALGVSRTTVGRIAHGEWRRRFPLTKRRPDDPTPTEIRERAREIRLRGGGELVLPEIARRRHLAEDSAANRSYIEQRYYETAPFASIGDQRRI